MLCHFLLGFLGVHLKILKIRVFLVVQLYVEMFEFWCIVYKLLKIQYLRHQFEWDICHEMHLVIWFLWCRFHIVIWDYIYLWDSGQEVVFWFLHREIFLCTDFLIFRIKLQLSFGKIVPVLELQLMEILRMEVLNFLGYLHFESFLCCMTVNV